MHEATLRHPATDKHVLRGRLDVWKSTVCLTLLLAAMPHLARGAAGDLDPSFGPPGLVTTKGDVAGAAEAVVAQPDGTTVVAGYTTPPPPNAQSAILVRFTADGSIDSSFGVGGQSVLSLTGEHGFLALARQPDGKLVAGGYHRPSPSVFGFVLARYEANGTLDATFGDSGVVAGTVMGAATGVVVQPDGKIVIGGGSSAPGEAVVARYNADGSVDAAFGSGGSVTVTGVGGNDIVRQSDGKIVIVGQAFNTFGVARVDSSGVLDGTFGTGGVVTVPVSPEGSNGAQAVALQGDGKIIVVGDTSSATSSNDLTAVRYTTTGALDTTFGVGGVAATDFDDDSDFAYDVLVQADGSVVVGGTAWTSQGIGFALVRYTTAGVLDPTFGDGGKVVTNFGPNGDEEALAVAQQADGKIILAGYDVGGCVGQAFALARYTNCGTADTDGDGASDDCDNCPSTANASQIDVDTDSSGDVCDNCPTDYNPDQRNSDAQGGGDLCDTCPSDTTDTCNTSKSASGTIGPLGGPISTPDGSLTLSFPSGVFTSDTTVSITGGLATSEYSVGTSGTRVLVVKFEPDNVTCGQPVTAEFAWPDVDDNGFVDGTGIRDRNLRVWRNGTAITGQCDNTAFQTPACTTACCDYQTADAWTLQLTGFSEYVVVEEPCDESPRTGCRVPLEAGKGSFVVKDKSPDAKDKVSWKWLVGSETQTADFGDPVVPDGDDYALCLYAGPTSLLVGRGTARAGASCVAGPCWQTTSSGFSYKSLEGQPDGMIRLSLVAGSDGQARVKVKGKGVDLLMPSPPLTTPVRVQLQAGNGECWEATYSTPLKNAPGLFKARPD